MNKSKPKKPSKSNASRIVPRRIINGQLTVHLDEDRAEVLHAIAAMEDRTENDVVCEAISLLALVYTASAGEGHVRDRKQFLAAALMRVQGPNPQAQAQAQPPVEAPVPAPLDAPAATESAVEPRAALAPA